MKFSVNNGRTSYVDDKRNDITIANFTAEIIEEHRYIDGKKIDRHYMISGKNDTEKFDDVMINSDEFNSMRWVTNAWGSRAVIFPKNNSREYLRTIMQISSTPVIKTIYTHTGWIRIEGVDYYITNGNAISGNRKRNDIELKVPSELLCYQLPLKTENFNAAVKATLNLRERFPREIAWMIIGAIFRAPLGSADFCIHITGRTGTYKSEIAAIAQSHFGEVDARKLPASWSSTANALEALAYKAKDALIVVDDFIPQGTSAQIKSYQKTADQLIRGQGNQAGRARLTDTSNLQETMYPRGIILSTGEDTPEGQSVRGRMMIAELTPGDITTELLTAAQNDRPIYAEGMTAYIQWLAADKKDRRKDSKKIAVDMRDASVALGHSRTPQTYGELMSGIWMFLRFLGEKGMKTETVNKLFAEAEEYLTKLARRQAEYIIAADPAEQFTSILRSIFAANAGHAKGMNGGIPKKAMLLGWTNVGDVDENEFKSHGPRLGWTEESTNTLYLDAAIAYDAIRRHSRGSITITRQTLYKRLREAGYLTKHDETRQRNTIRIQCENATRTCLAMNLKAITEGESNV